MKQEQQVRTSSVIGYDGNRLIRIPESIKDLKTLSMMSQYRVVSKGYNCGYSCNTCHDDEFIISMEKFDKILDIDWIGYTATVEAAVTYRQLANALKDNSSSLRIDPTDSTQHGSVIGNSTQHGLGVNYLSDHFGSIVYYTVIYKGEMFNIKPELLNNDMIVLSGKIKLLNINKHSLVIMECPKDKVEHFINNQMGLNKHVKIMNKNVTLSINCDRPNNVKDIDKLIKDKRISDFTIVYPISDDNNIAVSDVKKYRLKYKVFNKWMIDIMDNCIFKSILYFMYTFIFNIFGYILPIDNNGINSIVQYYNLTKGKPTDHFVHHFNGLHRNNSFYNKKNSGYICMTFVINNEIMKHYDNVEMIYKDKGMDYFNTMITLRDGEVIFYLGIAYDKNKHYEVNDANLLFKEVQQYMNDNLIKEYRKGLMSN